ncbi:carboxylating nicotinate-nucleotide diphosphorylase [Jatrophihabitans telluris]|uniref:nicotinate-nucleotide diphosphorylase (carboxylating) n=1 Tax=Jatrophihabitans telluris TaxID=2038343 RepID=A0ABY4QZA3_9ACTN|nr:carboxylating nicotinate-nucleotide diphosphorylase [Jatrophihabitans telluris]UQX88924.1 carboxylating nicotinate-nucleotide diphosphorylase [Jatrophihabitans telluris]
MIPPDVLDAIAAVGLDPAEVARVVTTALAEDLSEGADVTTAATIAADQLGRAVAVPRQTGVVAGLPVAALVFAIVSDGRVRIDIAVADGDIVEAGEPLLVATGPVRDLLTAERTALNLLTHLSGVATTTRLWVTAVAGTRAQIRDTRKTMPGLRALEKYAVRCGGGINHRMSLSDAALIKDNHVHAAGSVTRAFELVRAAAPGLPVEIEVDTPDQCAEAIAAGADLILLDNMSLPELRRCVQQAADADRPVRLEASGGLELGNAAVVAGTGVDYLAVGALTHSAKVLDIGLDLADIDKPAGPRAPADDHAN